MFLVISSVQYALIADAVAYEMLLAFPYHTNYVNLVRMAMNALKSAKPNFKPRSFAVLGSGPVPLASLCISRHLDNEHHGHITCYNVDRDTEAILSS